MPKRMTVGELRKSLDGAANSSLVVLGGNAPVGILSVQARGRVAMYQSGWLLLNVTVALSASPEKKSNIKVKSI